MKINEQSIFLFEQIPDLPNLKILSFLDPKSIGYLALTSRNARKFVGRQFRQAISIQKEQYQIKQESLLKYPESFSDYSKILEEIHLFQDTGNFKKFIQQMNVKNLSFYRNFLNSVLDKEIKMEQQNLVKLKESLQEIGDKFYQRLVKLKQNCLIPKFQLQVNLNQDQSQAQTVQLIKFGNKFLKIVKDVQSTKFKSSQFRQFSQTKKYLDMNRLSKTMKLSKRYVQPIVTLRKDKSYHDYLKFNQNSIIFSFLLPQDLMNLYLTDKQFSSQIPKLFPVLRSNQERTQANQNKFNDDQVKQITELIAKSDQVQIQKKSLAELALYKSPPHAVWSLFSLLSMLFNVKENLSINRKIKIILDEKFPYHNSIFHSEIIDLNKQQLQLINEYFTSTSLEQISHISLVCYKVCFKLLIHLKINQAGFCNKEMWHKYSKIRNNRQEFNEVERKIAKLSKNLEQNTLK